MISVFGKPIYKKVRKGTLIAPLTWVGGKQNLVKWLEDKVAYSTSYIEVFGGAGSMLLNRNKSTLEVYNDFDSNLFNLMLHLSDEELNNKLYFKCVNSFYSRQLQKYCYKLIKNKTYKNDLERAWATFIAHNQGFGGRACSFGCYINDKPRNLEGFNIRVNTFHEWYSRLKSVLIENKDCMYILNRYDNKNAVFYLDPPYLLTTRSETAQKVYSNELTEEYHINMLNKLKTMKSAIVISGYSNELYDDILKGWHKSEKKMMVLVNGRRNFEDKKENASRIECIWYNDRNKELLELNKSKKQTNSLF